MTIEEEKQYYMNDAIAQFDKLQFWKGTLEYLCERNATNIYKIGLAVKELSSLTLGERIIRDRESTIEDLVGWHRSHIGIGTDVFKKRLSALY